MKVSNNSFVKMHFKFRLKDGSIAEDTENYGKAFVFQMGQNCFTEKVESELLDCEVGDSKRVILMPKDAFGESLEANIYSVPRSRFPKDMELEEGLIVSFAQKDGTKLPGLVTELEEHDITVDFNHPLSGHIVVFEAKVLEIADKEEDLDESLVG